MDTLKNMALILLIMPVYATLAQTQNHADHSMISPSDISWMKAPPSFPPGAMIFIMDGDMKKEGTFTVRAKLPANYKIMPHWHLTAEHVTVLKGSFYMGVGETFDEKNAMEIPTGGFAVMKTGTRHYGFTSNEECIIQVHGTGPWSITYVNPTDDPRSQAK